MEFIANLLITIVAFVTAMFVVTLVHELGHYFVARLIIKEPNAKIYMGFFGKPIIDTKKIRITIFGFFGGYVGNFADDGSEKRSHWAMFFFAGAFFTILLAIPVSLYMTGTLSIGSFIAFLPSAPIRPDYISAQIEHGNIFYTSWLSLATPLDFFNMFIFFIRQRCITLPKSPKIYYN